MPDVLYNLKKVNYSYQWNQQEVPVLRDLDLEMKTGCFACIVGPSGTGKTTLLNVLGLIDSMKSGEMNFLGEDVGRMGESDREDFRLKKLGFIFQSFHLIPTLTVLENTAYFLPLMGLSQTVATEKSKQVLSLLGLEGHWNKKPLELSGGQRQRVAIARALAKSPAVILADEPTANLDQETATKTIEAFHELRRQNNTSFVFSTHDAHLVSYAENVYKMKEGRLV